LFQVLRNIFKKGKKEKKKRADRHTMQSRQSDASSCTKPLYWPLLSMNMD